MKDEELTSEQISTLKVEINNLLFTWCPGKMNLNELDKLSSFILNMIIEKHDYYYGDK